MGLSPLAWPAGPLTAPLRFWGAASRAGPSLPAAEGSTRVQCDPRPEDDDVTSSRISSQVCSATQPAPEDAERHTPAARQVQRAPSCKADGGEGLGPHRNQMPLIKYAPSASQLGAVPRVVSGAAGARASEEGGLLSGRARGAAVLGGRWALEWRKWVSGEPRGVAVRHWAQRHPVSWSSGGRARGGNPPSAEAAPTPPRTQALLEHFPVEISRKMEKRRRVHKMCAGCAGSGVFRCQLCTVEGHSGHGADCPQGAGAGVPQGQRDGGPGDPCPARGLGRKQDVTVHMSGPRGHRSEGLVCANPTARSEVSFEGPR